MISVNCPGFINKDTVKHIPDITTAANKNCQFSIIIFFKEIIPRENLTNTINPTVSEITVAIIAPIAPNLLIKTQFKAIFTKQEIPTATVYLFCCFDGIKY